MSVVYASFWPCQLCVLLFGHVSWMCCERVLFLFKTRVTSCPGGPCTLFRSSVLALYIYICFKAVSMLYYNCLSCVCFPLDMSAVYVFHWTCQLCMLHSGLVGCVCFTLVAPVWQNLTTLVAGISQPLPSFSPPAS